MSTRSTMWLNDEYHLYRDGFDNENVYLDIRAGGFEQLVLKIPLLVWKELRKHTIEPDETYLDLTDEQLRAEAEKKVDAHRTWLEENKDIPLAGLFGSFAFGKAESSRPEMIEHFMEYYRPQSTAQS